MSDLKIGHLLKCYLKTTENWCYRLMRHIPEAHLQIITANLKDEERFPLPEAEFVVAPFARLTGRDLSWPFNYLVKKIRLIFLLPWFYAVTRRARTLDIVHAHFSVMGWDYLWLVNYLSLPLVISFYGYDYEHLPRKAPKWRKRYQVLFDRAQLFIAEGEHGRRALISMGCPEEKVQVVHLGVEPALISICTRQKIPGRLRLVQVATFTEKKGYDSTVEAFALASKACPDMTLTLVGRDPEGMRQSIEALIRKCGVEQLVTIIDGVDFKQLHEFLADFDVFIHPSRYSSTGDCEGGAPVVLLDAQATGLPVIATTHCDIPDEVLNGKTGLLVAEGDIEGIAQSIKYFYNMDDPEYQMFCLHARRHVEEQFDATKNATLLRQLYQSVVTRSAAL